MPTSWPGARLPHVWLKPGELSVHDRIKDGYTLLRFGQARPMRRVCRKAFSAIGAPFSVLDLDGEAARRVYGFDYLLVRPDLHVVWRGNASAGGSGQGRAHRDRALGSRDKKPEETR